MLQVNLLRFLTYVTPLPLLGALKRNTISQSRYIRQNVGNTNQNKGVLQFNYTGYKSTKLYLSVLFLS
jgi:hypothetical protein